MGKKRKLIGGEGENILTQEWLESRDVCDRQQG